MRRRRLAAAALAAAVCFGPVGELRAEDAQADPGAPPSAGAQEEAAPSAPSETSAGPLPPSPLPPRGGRGLDSLLRPRGRVRLPTPGPAEERRGGLTRGEWVARFAAARAEIAEVEARLEEARNAVSERAGGAYTYSPIGGGESTDPEIVKLRAQLRRDKQSLEAAERRLRDLQVEASLQSVPVEWTEEPQPSAP